MSLSLFQKIALKKFVKKYCLAIPFALDQAEELGFSAWFLQASMNMLFTEPYTHPTQTNKCLAIRKDSNQRTLELFSSLTNQDPNVIDELCDLTHKVLSENCNRELKLKLYREAKALPHYTSAIETKNRLSAAFKEYKKNLNDVE